MDLYIVINVLIVLFFILMFINGVKKGFLFQLANMLGLLLALYISFYVSPVIADYIDIWPKNINNVEYQILNTLFYKPLNKFAWFIILFVVVSLIFMFIKPAIKFLQNIPILKQFNQFIGGIFGLLIANIWVLVIVFVLNMPLINNGSNIVKNTFFNDIVKVNNFVGGNYIKPILESEMFTKIIKNFNDLTDDDKIWLKNWLEENNVEDINIEELIKFE